MKLKAMLNADAERIRAGERVAMKRWLYQNGVLFDNVRCQIDTEQIEDCVREFDGDPEALKLKGREWVINMICEERGF